MIVIDTSVVVALYRQEEEADLFASSIGDDPEPLMSAGNLLEASIVMRGLKHLPISESELWLDDFLQTTGTRIEPVNREIVDAARAAHVRFGKGSGHPARLNYGDCFAYALAKAMSCPLLFKGNDFAQTDIVQALRPASRQAQSPEPG